MIDLSWSCFRQARIYVNKIQFCWSFYSTAKQFHVFHSWSPLTIIARLHIAANCKMKQKHGKERIFHQELTINLLFLLFLFLVVINWKTIEINSKTLTCVSAFMLPWQMISSHLYPDISVPRSLFRFLLLLDCPRDCCWILKLQAGS